ncbi:hypothetical protein U2H24_25445 [Bacillus cereus]|nr:hypothetical protein [Bacillus cereus]MEA1012877.1 hypothetical protein [Bacillus cereus]
MNYAYIRVSTPQQDYTFPKKAILTWGTETIRGMKDHSGKVFNNKNRRK